MKIQDDDFKGTVVEVVGNAIGVQWDDAQEGRGAYRTWYKDLLGTERLPTDLVPLIGKRVRVRHVVEVLDD